LEWRRFWDYQISKVLENTWREAMLEGVKINMTLQLALNARRLCFRPELYEVKEQYYNELKAFVSWPLRAEGLSGAPQLYSQIAERNSEYLVALYTRSQDMFARLEQVADTFRNWKEVAALDVEALEDRLTNEQLGLALGSLKDKKDSVDRIPSETKVGTFTVELSQLKETLTSILEQQIDSLIQLIRGQVKKECQDVETFITNAMEKISKKPANMEEIAEVLKNYEKVHAMQEEMQVRVRQIEDKNVKIRAMTGVSFNTANMLKRWENFEMASNDFARVLGKQKNNIRQEVHKRGQALEQEADKLLTKWQQIKPKSEKNSTNRLRLRFTVG
jgi:hypothetical protein